MNTLFGAVFVVFLALKLAEVGDVANWSWWAVFSPLIAGVVLWVVVVAIALFADD